MLLLSNDAVVMDGVASACLHAEVDRPQDVLIERTIEKRAKRTSMTTENLFEIVSTLEQKVWNSVVERHGAALGELFAHDYIEITLDGKRIEKNAVAELSPQVDEIDRYAIDSERAFMLGDNTVVFSYHLILDGRIRGTLISPRERWATSIWSRIDGRWWCRFFQQTSYRTEKEVTASIC